MKKLLLIVLVILNVVIFVFVINNPERKITTSKARYYFYFIGQNSIDPFWNEALKGAQDSAKEFGAVVNFLAPRFNDYSQQKKYLDMAIVSKVDGIITHSYDTEEFRILIEKAHTKNIPIITFENDCSLSKRYSFVGINSFEAGKLACELVVSACGGNGDVVIVINGDSYQTSVENNLKISGIFSYLKDFPNVQVSAIMTSKMGILSAEEIAKQVISKLPETKIILTFGTSDTIGVSQVIVNKNKVGQINVVGFGLTDEIKRYIKMGVIYGTVVSDPYKMGYEAVKTMINIKNGNYVSEVIQVQARPIKLNDLPN